MSINQFSPDFTDTLWWSRPISTNKRLLFPQIDRHHDHDEFLSLERSQQQQQQQQHEEYCTERESMFEKHLTPSDVGKLNRLVIPKQHAEKYFPLNNTNNNNNNTNNNNNGSGDKGLLLSFDDEAGKCWRFRYSYWNSSQSYVLTKGWSRYVKEKRLDAGDVVLFERDRVDLDRFFIGWRRRSTVAVAASTAPTRDIGISIGIGGSGDINGGWNRVVYSGHQPYPSHPFPYQPEPCLQLHAGSMVQTKTTPIVNSKRLRLFGVNLECQVDEEASEPPTPDGSSASSQGQVHQPHHNLYYPESQQNHNQMGRNSY